MTFLLKYKQKKWKSTEKSQSNSVTMKTNTNAIRHTFMVQILQMIVLPSAYNFCNVTVCSVYYESLYMAINISISLSCFVYLCMTMHLWLEQIHEASKKVVAKHIDVYCHRNFVCPFCLIHWVLNMLKEKLLFIRTW